MTDEQAKLHQFCRDSDVKSVINKFARFLRDYYNLEGQENTAISIYLYDDGSGHIQTQEGLIGDQNESLLFVDFYLNQNTEISND
jgi:hypothetical protein